ncbi:hypothetical protein SAMN05421880_12627 [Nitrosomonas nitrosa]|uniref:Uncharacterized protein n=1 Tax=Nitrosomonas nitrosa TaxID=52442 RepID=A0A1I4SSJ1_9PROT|nr:hypothetical protein SAMN05421880_12627 [Nitrosomonas nitrosa]
MNQQTNSGKYVNYVDARSSSRSTGVVFSSANSESLASIVRNRSFYSELIVYPGTIGVPNVPTPDESENG